MEGSERRELDVSTSHNHDAGAVELRVADNRRGLDPQVAHRLFEPFMTTKKSGMGLGLSICHEIIEAHGGQIAASPRQPSGTVFLVTLPAAQPKGEADV